MKASHEHGVTKYIKLKYQRIFYSIKAENFLVICLNLGFYLCLVPYRFNYDKDDDSINLHSNSLQKIFCCIIHTFHLLKNLCKWRMIFEKEFGGNPVDYLLVIWATNSILYYCQFFCFLWTKSEDVNNLVQYLNTKIKNGLWQPNGHFSAIGSSCIIRLLLGFYMLVVVNCIWRFEWSAEPPVFGFLFPVSIGVKYDPNGNNEGVFNYLALLSTFSYFNLLMGFFELILISCHLIASYYGDILFLMIGLTLWLPSRTLATALQNDNLQSAFQVRDMYKELKRVSQLLNKAVGTVVFFFTCDTLMYYSTHLLEIMTAHWTQKIFVGVSFICCGAVFILSGDAARQAEKVILWFMDTPNEGKIENSELQLMIQELTSLQPIGLSAADIFKINFAFVTNALSTLLTIFILCVQFTKA